MTVANLVLPGARAVPGQRVTPAPWDPKAGRDPQDSLAPLAAQGSRVLLALPEWG